MFLRRSLVPHAAGPGRAAEPDRRQVVARAGGESKDPAALLLQEPLRTFRVLHTPGLSQRHCRYLSSRPLEEGGEGL